MLRAAVDGCKPRLTDEIFVLQKKFFSAAHFNIIDYVGWCRDIYVIQWDMMNIS